jgi:ribose/xylose/arabinose/galactoside ABC-type transport system permease subunit
MGTGYELRAIAAVVIGGTPLFGGRGTIVGTLGGVLLLGLVSNSMNLLGVGANYQSAVLGLIITAAVLLQRRT